MQFRDFSTEDNNLYNLEHLFYWSNSYWIDSIEKNRIGNWSRCDKSNEGLISLETNECRNVDIRLIAIEANSETKKMRISAIIWSNALLELIDKQGYKHYPVKRKSAQSPENQGGGISELVYCDFGEDDQSQETARIFLQTLSQNRRDRIGRIIFTASILGSNTDQNIIASQIDLLAINNNIKPPCFGFDWSRRVDKNTKELRAIEAFAKKPEVPKEKANEVPKVEDNKSSLKQYGVFAAGFVMGAAIAVASQRLGS